MFKKVLNVLFFATIISAHFIAETGDLQRFKGRTESRIENRASEDFDTTPVYAVVNFESR